MHDELQWLEKHGFVHGNNFHCYSEHAIDSNWPWLISVGDNVMISTDVKILAHDASTGYGNGKTKIGIVKIGNNVFVGTKTTILCNVRIGDNIIIGANSVVTHDLESDCVYCGNPAKMICTMEEFKTKHTDNLKKHKIFNSRKWDTWIEASPEEWEQMKNDLTDTFGYI